MASTSPDNIFYPVSADTYALAANLATQASTVQAALDKRQNYDFRWDDGAARVAQTGMRAGDTGYQISTGVRYFYDGTVWRPEGQTEYQMVPTSVSGGSINEYGTFFATSGSSVSLNGIFNAAFSDYRVWISTYGSVAQQLSWRFRAGGADVSTTTYSSVRTRGTFSAAAPVTTNNSGGTEWTFNGSGTQVAIVNDLTLNLYRPGLAVYTRGSGRLDQSTPTGLAGQDGHALSTLLNNGATAFDGFTLACSPGTFAGVTIKVFGLRN